MPPKLSFRIEAKDSGLMGNRQRVDIHVTKAPGITLQSLKMQVADVRD